MQFWQLNWAWCPSTVQDTSPFWAGRGRQWSTSLEIRVVSWLPLFWVSEVRSHDWKHVYLLFWKTLQTEKQKSNICGLGKWVGSQQVKVHLFKLQAKQGPSFTANKGKETPGTCCLYPGALFYVYFHIVVCSEWKSHQLFFSVSSLALHFHLLVGRITIQKHWGHSIWCEMCF